MITSVGSMKGKCYFFRTVTYHQVGKVKCSVEVGNNLIVTLENASWVADSGRFGDTIIRGIIKESEYVGDAYINLNSVTDFFPWKHELPSESKTFTP